jgi:hypothetical protein
LRETPEKLDHSHQTGENHRASSLCRQLRGLIFNSGRKGILSVCAAQQIRVSRSIFSGIAITFLLILGAVTAWLVPLPVIYYRIKLGRWTGMIIPGLMLAILLLIGKSVTTELVVVSGWMLLGIMIGECFVSRQTIEKTILYSSSTVLVSGVLVLLFYSNMVQTDRKSVV